MQLDPKKFAFLTATIATSISVVATTVTGCTIESTGDGDNSSGGVSSSSSGDPGTSSSSGGGSSSSSSSSGATDAGTDSGSDAGSCLSGGDPVTASECTPTAGVTTCGGDEYYEGLCNGPRVNFVPAVAQKAIDCLKTTPVCESEEADACLEDAIAEACEDAGAEAFCRQLATDAECPLVDGELPFTLESCVRIVGALNTEGRTALTECFEDGAGATCTDEDIGYCFSTQLYAYSLD